MPEIRASIGRNINDNAPQARMFPTPDALFESLLKPAGALKDGPYFQLASYKPGAHRDKNHVELMYGYVGDLDKGDISAEQIEEALAGTSAVVYSSYSSMQGDRRWRFVIPFASPVPVPVFQAAHEACFKRLFPDIDPRSKEPAQAWYWRREYQEVRQYEKRGNPARPPGPFMPHDDAFEVEGELFDAWEYAELAIEAEEAAHKPDTGTFGVGFEEGQLEDVMSALAAIDGTDREQWFRVMCALHSTGDDAAWDILDEWSQQFATYDAEENAHQWDSLSNSKERKYTLGTLFWDARQAGWRGHTLAQAVEEAANTELQQQLRQYLVPHDELMSGEDEAIPWVVEDIIADKELTSLFGAPGTMKSFVALDWAVHIASGEDWHGRPVRQGPVAYLTGEGFTGLKMRYRAAVRAKGAADLAVVISRYAEDLLDPERRSFVIEALRARFEQYAAIFIDTKARFSSGNENSAEDASNFVAAVDLLRRAFDCAVIVVHHTGKNGDERGSTAWIGGANTRWKVTKAPAEYSAFLTGEKQKDSDTDDGEPSIQAEFEKVETGATKRDGTPQTTLVLMRCKSPETGTSIEAVRPKGKNQQALARHYDLLVAERKASGEQLPSFVKRDAVIDRYMSEWDRNNIGATGKVAGEKRRNMVKALEGLLDGKGFERSGDSMLRSGSIHGDDDDESLPF